MSVGVRGTGDEGPQKPGVSSSVPTFIMPGTENRIRSAPQKRSTTPAGSLYSDSRIMIDSPRTTATAATIEILSQSRAPRASIFSRFVAVLDTILLAHPEWHAAIGAEHL